MRIFTPLFAVVFLLFALLPISAMAATAGVSDIGFFVQAVIPENQLDASLTYFDLKMEPGKKQTLEIEVVNESAEDMDVSLEAISASTNPYGVIDYKTPGVRDTSLKTPFSDIATLNSEKVHVPAGGTALAGFTVDMPKESYDGVILGGIVLTKDGAEPSAEETGVGGTLIHNKYSYVIGVKLTETDTKVAPDFELFDVKADAVNYEAAVVHYIRNKEAAVVKGMQLDTKIYLDGQKEPVAHVEKKDVDMAPNSVMELAATLLPTGQTPDDSTSAGGGAQTENSTENNTENNIADGSASSVQNNTGTTTGAVPSELAPGNYTSVTTLRYGGENWVFEKKFVVGKQEAELINATASPGQVQGPFWWVLLVIGIFVLLVVAIILLLVLLKRKKKKERADTRRIYRKR